MSPEQLKILERMYNNGVGAPVIAQALGVCESTVYKWMRKIDANAAYDRPSIAKQLPLQKKVQAEIVSLLKYDPDLSAQAIGLQLVPPLSAETVTRYLKEIGQGKNRKCLLAAVTSRNTPDVIAERALYAYKLLCKRHDHLVFLGTAEFSILSSARYVYCHIDDEPVKPMLQANLIAAIYSGGVVSFSTEGGTFDVFRLQHWCENSLIPSFGTRQVTVIMDNRRMLWANELRHLLQAKGYEVLYLPPHSPELNPIEGFFDMVRARTKTVKPQEHRRSEDWIETITSISRSLMGISMENLFEGMKAWLAVAMEGKEFNQF